MIFDVNTTTLGSSIPMAEGYDCSTGAAMALVESAQSDYAMFRAMLNVEAREAQIKHESTGYVAESQIIALSEATGSGIWTKIKEIFHKFIAKIKGIIHNFVARVSGLFMKDKNLAKKYEKELYKKANLDKLEVKWAELNSSGIGDFTERDSVASLENDWVDDADARAKKYLPGDIDIDDFESSMNEKYFPNRKDPESKTLKDIGGVRTLISALYNFEKEYKNAETGAKKKIAAAEKVEKDADKKAKNTIAANKDAGSGLSGNDADNAKKNADNAINAANHTYDMAVVYTSTLTRWIGWWLGALKDEYKFYKSAFMKAVTVNGKKLEESAVYAQAIAEEAEQEVDDVIDGAISKEEISDINAASTNVKDGDVCDDVDGNCLTGGVPNRYNNTVDNSIDGEKDTDINSNVSESAFFSELLY